MFALPLAALRAVLGLPFLAARTVVSVVSTPLRSEPESVVSEAAPKGGGKYDQPLFAAVANTPGITVAQAADKVGVAASGLYPAVRRLEAQGLIVKRGTGLHVE